MEKQTNKKNKLKIPPVSHNVNIFPLRPDGGAIVAPQASSLCPCVRLYVRACALTGTGGNSSETGAKAMSQSPVDALVPEPAALHVDTGPSEGEAPLERGKQKHLLELDSKRENLNAHRLNDENSVIINPPLFVPSLKNDAKAP